MESKESNLLGNPFKGLDSYQIEDGGVFFGRDADSEILIARILSSSFTLLHARSGAGKTSLLNARIVPDLESQGWTVVVARPGADPVWSVHDAVLRSLVPPPVPEWTAVLRALEVLFPGAPASEKTLEDLIQAFRPVRGELRRQLLSPVPLAPSTDGDSQTAELVYPQFCRLLRGGLRLDEYVAHVAALSGKPPQEFAAAAGPGVELPFLGAALLHTEQGPYALLRASLDVHADNLTAFLRTLFDVYGLYRPDLSLVIVVDQFEELFTRYGDRRPDRPETLDYTLRDGFFKNLAQLSHRMQGGRKLSKTVAAETPLPVRCVISIRQEFIADLDPIRRFVQDLDQHWFHLDRLQIGAAGEVLGATDNTPRPFPATLRKAILEDLIQEGRYVEPTELQIVGSTVFQDKRDPEQAFHALGRTTGILDRFFVDLLNSIQRLHGMVGRIETLEILNALVTSSGKNPRPEDELVENALFHDRVLRGKLVNLLEQERIIRSESRGGRTIVEIRHDFLVNRILDAFRNEIYRNPEHSRFHSALAALRMCLELRQTLTEEQFASLARYVDRIDWTWQDTDGFAVSWTPAELMLQGAIAHATQKDMEAQTQGEVQMQYWYDRLDNDDRGLSAADIPQEWWDKRYLDSRQLTALNSNPASWNDLTADQLLFVVRSHLFRCAEYEQDLIANWTAKWKNKAAEEEEREATLHEG